MDFKVDRRRFLVGAGTAVISIPGLHPVLAQGANRDTQGELAPELENVKALVFDTFGTVVDWRSSVIAEGMKWGKAKGIQIDWAQFADRWRLGYRPTMDKVRKGEIPWTRLDDLHRMILEELLKEYKIQGLTEEEKVSWTYVWRRLEPWPDSVAGLTRLKKKYIIAPLSNGNIALMANLALDATTRIGSACLLPPLATDRHAVLHAGDLHVEDLVRRRGDRPERVVDNRRVRR